MTHKSFAIYMAKQSKTSENSNSVLCKMMLFYLDSDYGIIYILWNNNFRMLRYGQFGIRRLSQSQVLSAKKLQYLIDNQWKGTETKIYPAHLQSYFCHKNDTSSFLREFQK